MRALLVAGVLLLATPAAAQPTLEDLRAAACELREVYRQYIDPEPWPEVCFVPDSCLKSWRKPDVWCDIRIPLLIEACATGTVASQKHALNALSGTVIQHATREAGFARDGQQDVAHVLLNLGVEAAVVLEPANDALLRDSLLHAAEQHVQAAVVPTWVSIQSDISRRHRDGPCD